MTLKFRGGRFLASKKQVYFRGKRRVWDRKTDKGKTSREQGNLRTEGLTFLEREASLGQ